MIGQKLGSFEVVEKIGAGAMGIVYRAVSEKTGKSVAVKVITQEQVIKGNSAARFEREAEILQGFRHPNIVRYLAHGRSRGTSYFAMEFIKGETLEDLLEKREYLPWPEVVELGIQICDALHYAHQRGVVHRDLKPSNLMINESGQVKLTDFGIAKDLDATTNLTAPGRTLGTAAYMAPEQIRGTPEVSHKTDLYALGCLFYQMLTGQPPFQGATAIVLMNCHLSEDPQRPSAKSPDLPRALDDLTLQLMAKAPQDRPWDASAAGMVLTELRDKLARGEPIAMVFAGTASPSRPGPNAETGLTVDLGLSSTFGGTASRPRKKKRKKKPLRFWLETGGLVLAGLGVVALIAYLAWPPSAEYLIARARPLMASENLDDWLEADRRYLGELDRRFPDGPYRDQVRAWRDQIALKQKSRRAGVMEKSALAGVSEPRDEAERVFAGTTAAASALLQGGADLDARRKWLEMVEALKGIPEARGWVLLAESRVVELDQKINNRQRDVLAQLAQADNLQALGHPEAAVNVRRKVIAEFGKYSSLADLIARARAGLPPEAAPEAGPDPERPAEAPPDENDSESRTPKAEPSESPGP